jgi:hypothetical protein
MIGKFFHTPGTKKFGITPRFWDPEKEAREERERRIKEEMGIVDEKTNDGRPFRPNIRGQFRAQGASRSTEAARRSQNRRLIWIIMILVLVLYLFFYSDFFK